MGISKILQKSCIGIPCHCEHCVAKRSNFFCYSQQLVFGDKSKNFYKGRFSTAEDKGSRRSNLVGLRWLVFFLAFFLLPLSSFAAYSDVSETHSHFQAIFFLSEKGIIGGYSDGTFRPDNAINRAELLKMVMEGKKALGAGENDTAATTETVSDSSETSAFHFSDVEISAWYTPYLQTAFSKGVVAGYSDGTFRPAKTVNLAEALKIILLAFETPMDASEVSEAPYPDVASDAWFAAYALFARDANLVDADDFGFLHADKLMTRGGIADILYRFLVIRETGVASFDITRDWPTFTRQEHHFSIKYPADWLIEKNENRTVTWKKMEQQASFEQKFPNSASVTLFVDSNAEGLSSQEYFDALRGYFSGYPSVEMKSFDWKGSPTLRIVIQSPYEVMNDWYVYLPNKKILVFAARIGVGTSQAKREKEILALEHSFSYMEYDEAASQSSVLTMARENIFVDGNGKATLELFSDRELIETDAIGVGTGPVDYYYSAWADVTVKYERSYDVILGIEEGKTTKF